MLAAAVTSNCREVHIALPATDGDVYRQHQLVWEAMRGVARHGRDFVYAMLSPNVALVRSERLTRGKVCAFREDKMRVLLATARQTDRGLVALGPADATAMAEDLLARNGIRAAGLQIDGQDLLQGSKLDRDSGRRHAIRIPVSQLNFKARFTNTALALLAAQNGIGRAKRFGCGMLLPAP